MLFKVNRTIFGTCSVPRYSFIFKYSKAVGLALDTFKVGRRRTSDIKRILERREIMLRHLNYRRQLGGNLPIPSKIDLFVLGCGNGTPKSIIIDMDYTKYCFNCGEGTQRIINEQNLKIARIEDVFFSQFTWDNISGMTGLYLTIQDKGVSLIRAHGPPLIEEIMNQTKTFTSYGKKLSVEYKSAIRRTVRYEAMAINIYPLEPEVSENSKAEALKRTTVVYLCKPYRKLRKIDMEKLASLNIPRSNEQKGGKKKEKPPNLVKKLIDGETIELPNGKKLVLEDIISPSEDKKYFIIVDCPSEDFIRPLMDLNLHEEATLAQDLETTEGIEDRELDTTSPLTEDPTKGEIVLDIIVHLSPPHIIQNEKYKLWMKKFGRKTKHLIVNEQGTGNTLNGVHLIQTRLNLLHDDIFPIIHAAQRPIQPLSKKEEIPAIGDAENVTYGDPGMRYIFRGRCSSQGTYEYNSCFKIDKEDFLKDLLEDEDFQTELTKLKSKLTSTETAKGVIDSRQYPEIVFLGTGSMIPSEMRNVSAILVHINEDECLLLDCGEDTYGQLCRHYGPQVDNILAKLKAIYVSHLHTDHHMGLTGVALKRHECFRRMGKAYSKLQVIAPARYQDWLTGLEKVGIPLVDLVNVIICEGLKSSEPMYEATVEEVRKHIGLQNIETCQVIHKQYPHGVSLTLSNGYRMVYSGDTMPCVNLEKLGENCDLLIHEATMEDDLIEDAMLKRHSITSHAIESGHKMKAKFIILTHFSQRYAKIPMFNDKFTDTVGIAFDNMRVRPNQLHLLPLFIPALKALFAEHYSELEKQYELRNERRDEEHSRKKNTGFGESEMDRRKIIHHLTPEHFSGDLKKKVEEIVRKRKMRNEDSGFSKRKVVSNSAGTVINVCDVMTSEAAEKQTDFSQSTSGKNKNSEDTSESSRNVHELEEEVPQTSDTAKNHELDTKSQMKIS